MQALAADAEITLTGGGAGIFDIIVDGVEKYSKHKTGTFPGDDAVRATLAP